MKATTVYLPAAVMLSAVACNQRPDVTTTAPLTLARTFSDNMVLQRDLPSRLYNGMIAPLTPMTVRGVLWYQGESSAHTVATDEAFGRRPDAGDYGDMLARMIGAWRAEMQNDEAALVIVQLPIYNDDIWPLVREGQRACSALPNTAMAVTIDTGLADDGHPMDKRPVGTRAALAALGEIFGRKLPGPHLGPVLRSLRVDGSAAILTFDHAGEGLVAKNDALTGFEVAGPDGTFLPAQGSAEGDTVTLSNPAVGRVVSVRYAWAGVPEISLSNSHGLPAGPFRADTDGQ